MTEGEKETKRCHGNTTKNGNSINRRKIAHDFRNTCKCYQIHYGNKVIFVLLFCL